jgi:hypothetical protein
MNGTRIGVGLAKSVCEIAVSQTPGSVQEGWWGAHRLLHGYLQTRTGPVAAR